MRTYSEYRPFDPELERPLRELLRRFAYRPGWTFAVEDGALMVTATVIDAENQTATVPLSFRRQLPSVAHFAGDFDWAGWLFTQVLTMERHETEEFFRVDGRPVYEPHPELERA